MEAYTGFAEVYDLFMDTIPYEEWAQYVMQLLETNGISPKSDCPTIVDLGCGTGTFTEILANAGFQMIGIDNSEDMLVIANNKKFANDSESQESDTDQDTNQDEESSLSSTIYSLQDMRDFAVPYPVAAVVCVCDSMNYIIEEEELIEVFQCVKEALDENGIFIFDMKTQHFFKDILGEQTIAENRDNAAFIWDNYYDEDESVNEYELAIFVEEENGLYRKYEETHVQRGYTIEEVRKALHLAGLEIINIYEAFTEKEPDAESERIYFVVK